MRVAMICQPRDRLVSSERLSGSVGIVAAELAKVLGDVDLTLYIGTEGGSAERTIGPGSHPVVLVPAGSNRVEQARELLSSLLPGFPPHFTSPAYHRGYFDGVATSIAREPPDIVHLNTSFQHATRLRAAAPAARIVLHLHDPHPAGLATAATSTALEAVDAVVTCSDSVSRRMRDAFPPHAGKVVTIGNGVDPAAFAGGPGGEAAPGRLLFVGRISPEKGVHVLAEAFNRVVAVLPEATLDLVGKPGFLPAAILRLIADDALLRDLAAFYGRDPITGLARQVLLAASSYRRAVEHRLSPAARQATRFLGAVPHERMPEVYAASAVAVVPSVWPEPFGLPVVEAMAAGRPVVASRVGGIPELVAHGETGLLVEPDDPEALAAALLTLLQDPGRGQAMGVAGRRHAAERWSWQRAAERLRRVYASLLRGDTVLRRAG
jgi:glycosyltransferase involved in cell wall biosynthesis